MTASANLVGIITASRPAVSARFGLNPCLDGNGDRRRGRAKAIPDLQSLIELYPMTVAVARRATNLHWAVARHTEAVSERL